MNATRTRCRYAVHNALTGTRIAEGAALPRGGEAEGAVLVGIASPPWIDYEVGEQMPGEIRIRYACGTVETLGEDEARVSIVDS